MTSDYPNSTYAVLGLVDKVPNSSGYDLAAVASRSFAHFWPISQTLLYRELERLTDLGWVAATRVEQIKAPGKWTYQTTDAGQQALVNWLAGPAPPKSSFRSGFLLKLFFAYRMQPSQVRALLDDYRRATQAQCEELEATTAKLEAMATPEARAGQLIALHGLRTAEARLAWIHEAEALTEESPQ
jgi:PadR family transcriptional regulator, regulatory protein AphA